MERIHAFSDDALGDDDAVGLVARLQAGEVSAAELAEAALARIARVDPALGAIAFSDDAATRDSAATPRPGFFSGVPTLLKDNVDVAGYPTQDGTDAHVAPPAVLDGDVARLFRALGVVIAGKTRMSEFGFSAACEHPRGGPVRTPWNPDHTAGASSSGAGALVGAGAVPFAHGNDGGGSIRIPASVNGLVGLKPTRGRTPSEALSRQMPVKIVADGVVTRSVRDTAAFLRESEKIYRDRSLQPVGDVTSPIDRPLRIGVTTQGVGHAATDEVAALTRRTAERLSALGHHVEEVEIPVPDAFAGSFLAYWGMLAAFVSSAGRKEHADWRPENLDNLTRGLAGYARRRALTLPAHIAFLAASGRVTSSFYRAHDVLLTPTLAHETPLTGHLDPTAEFEQVMARLLDWVAFTPLQNATGEPAVSLPVELTAAGLPQGMHFSAARGQDALLLRLALQVEGELGFTDIRR